MEDPEVEIAEEADISLNGSICDSMSTFGGGDARYRDFDDDKAQNISLKSFATASSEDRFEGSEEPRLKYDRLASDIKEILAHDTASAFAVHDKFIVVGNLTLFFTNYANLKLFTFQEQIGVNCTYLTHWDTCCLTPKVTLATIHIQWQCHKSP